MSESSLSWGPSGGTYSWQGFLSIRGAPHGTQWKKLLIHTGLGPWILSPKPDNNLEPMAQWQAPCQTAIPHTILYTLSIEYFSGPARPDTWWTPQGIRHASQGWFPQLLSLLTNSRQFPSLSSLTNIFRQWLWKTFWDQGIFKIGFHENWNLWKLEFMKIGIHENWILSGFQLARGYRGWSAVATCCRALLV